MVVAMPDNRLLWRTVSSSPKDHSLISMECDLQLKTWWMLTKIFNSHLIKILQNLMC